MISILDYRLSVLESNPGWPYYGVILVNTILLLLLLSTGKLLWYLFLQGCHGLGKVRERQKFFKVREKSGNFVKGQGKS